MASLVSEYSGVRVCQVVFLVLLRLCNPCYEPFTPSRYGTPAIAPASLPCPPPRAPQAGNAKSSGLAATLSGLATTCTPFGSSLELVRFRALAGSSLFLGRKANRTRWLMLGSCDGGSVLSSHPPSWLRADSLAEFLHGLRRRHV